jgi:hypothetical protein
MSIKKNKGIKSGKSATARRLATIIIYRVLSEDRDYIVKYPDALTKYLNGAEVLVRTLKEIGEPGIRLYGVLP